MQHVPYRGSAPMLTDLLAGQVQVAFDNMQPSMPHIKAGTLRASGSDDSDALGSAAQSADGGRFRAGYEASTGTAFCAPRNTPVEIVDTLNREINAGLADPKTKATARRNGCVGSARLPCRLRQTDR